MFISCASCFNKAKVYHLPIFIESLLRTKNLLIRAASRNPRYASGITFAHEELASSNARETLA